MNGGAAGGDPQFAPRRKLPRAFYARDPVSVARDLLGTFLVRVSDGTPFIGKIVEVEAYLGPEDLASHSSKGRTARTSVMFGPPGHAYVFLVYGMHSCMNIVTGPAGHGAAVLLRAVEPVKNLDGDTRGPGRLCKAMHIDRRLNAHDLTGDDFFVAAPSTPVRIAIARRPRIGVDYAGRWARRLLRFYVRGNPYISKP
jgi:DNA-3-methyladenine glycosylase